jgi:hypothetical protein
MILKYQPKRKKKFRKTLEKMEGFNFVTPLTGPNRPNTGKEGDDDDDDVIRITEQLYSNAENIRHLLKAKNTPEILLTVSVLLFSLSEFTLLILDRRK